MTKTKQNMKNITWQIAYRNNAIVRII